MRVLHLSPEGADGSGVGTYAELFRDALARQGVELVPFAAAPGVLHSVGRIRRHRARAVAAAREADVVHAELGAGGLAEFYALRAVQGLASVPTCATIHDPPLPVWSPFQVAALRRSPLAARAVGRASRPLARELEVRTLRACGALFVLTRSGVAAVEARLGRGGPDVEYVEHQTRRAPASTPAPEGHDLRLATFGYWYPGKGFELLVEAVAALRSEQPPVRLRCWGRVSGAAGQQASARYLSNVAALVSKLGASDVIELCGEVPEESVPQVLGACDALVLPYPRPPGELASLRSTSGAMYAALAAGVPVVASRVRALDEVIVDGLNGLLYSPQDETALVSVLRRLRDDTQLRERLRAGAQATAARFEPDRAAAAVVARYRALSRRP